MRTMRPEVKRWLKIIFCSLLVVFSVSIGFSDWVAPGDGKDVTKGSEKATTTDVVPTAYLLSNPTVKYSVQDAIIKANSSSDNEVVVTIPGMKTDTITKNITINSNVTLNIPYQVDDNGTPAVNLSVAAVTSSKFSSNTNKVFNLKLASGIILRNNGIIEIGGVLGSGSGGQDSGGQTCGLYSTIEMDSNSCIENFGVINCYGLITEKIVNNDSSLICEPTGRIFAPFIIRDFKGGSATYAAYSASKDKYSPFNLFEMRNIFPTIQFKYGSQLKGWANLYANDDYQAMTFNVIGSNSSSVITLNEGSYLISKYVSSDGQYTTEGYMKLDFYGSVNINSLAFKFKVKILITYNINISTSAGFFPISYLMKLHFHALKNQSCFVSTGNQGFKIMPGSSLIIDKGVTMTTSELIIYPEGEVKQVVSQTYKKTTLPIVKVNGVLAGSAIGGTIDVENEGSVLSRSNTSAVTSYEMTAVKTMSISDKQTFTQQLNIRLIKNGVVSDNFENVDGSKYLSRTISSKSGYEAYTENFPITINYIAGSNAKSATKTVSSSLYDFYGMLSESDLSVFINSGYMIENFTAYTDGTSSNPLSVNVGNGVFLSELVFSDIKDTKTLYIKVNCVKYREIKFYYQTEWGNNKSTRSEKYAENAEDKFYKLLTVEDELGFSFGQYLNWVLKDYIFQNYKLYPGVTSQKGNAAMTVDEEGQVVDLGSDELKEAWNKQCMFVYINRQRQ